MGSNGLLGWVGLTPAGDGIGSVIYLPTLFDALGHVRHGTDDQFGEAATATG